MSPTRNLRPAATELFTISRKLALSPDTRQYDGNYWRDKPPIDYKLRLEQTRHTDVRSPKGPALTIVHTQLENGHRFTVWPTDAPQPLAHEGRIPHYRVAIEGDKDGKVTDVSAFILEERVNPDGKALRAHLLNGPNQIAEAVRYIAPLVTNLVKEP